MIVPLSNRHASSLCSALFFARLYLDEDVDVLVADLVRAQGFSVTTVRRENRLGDDDEEHLAFAAAQNRVVVTHNRADFEALAVRYFNEGRTHAGIVCAFRRSPHEVAARLIRLVNEYAANELKNQLVYL